MITINKDNISHDKRDHDSIEMNINNNKNKKCQWQRRTNPSIPSPIQLRTSSNRSFPSTSSTRYPRGLPIARRRLSPTATPSFRTLDAINNW